MRQLELLLKKKRNSVQSQYKGAASLHKRCRLFSVYNIAQKKPAFRPAFSFEMQYRDDYLETSDSAGCDSVLTILAVCSVVRLDATHET